MNYLIIQFEKETPSLLRELSLDSTNDLVEASKAITSPTIWVVPDTALQKLAIFPDIIDDRGKKHKAMELSRVLLHGDQITMVDGGFSSAGRLRQSVEKFLKKIDDSSGRLFIIGATEEIFSRLKKDARQTASRDNADRQPEPARPASGILALLNPGPVPDELRRKYVGKSPEAEEVRQLIMLAAKIKDVVLITGDTGTGKEIVARQIHEIGRPSKEAPFIVANCGALTSGLFESEVFGHKIGSFTDAKADRTGLWRAAKGGTLFLDEVGELTLDLQVKVLRALQDSHVRPVGEEKEERVDTRVIAATNRDLYAMVQSGAFREDLYYRLRGFLIHTPSLREHPEDIPIIAFTLWRNISGDSLAQLSKGVMGELCNYSWPGNVRELKMVLIHLHGLFGARIPLEEKHIRAVFEMQGQGAPQRQTKDAVVLQPMSAPFAAFNRLRRTYETIRAVEHLLKPVIQGTTEIADVAGLREKTQLLLNELDSLCRYPHSFTQGTFDSVNIVRLRLSSFCGQLAENPSRARSYFTEAGQQIFEAALSSLLQEIDTVFTAIG